MANVDFGGPVKGGAQRSFSREGYGKTVSDGGARRSPAQAGGQQPDQQGFAGGPQIPNLTPAPVTAPPTAPEASAPDFAKMNAEMGMTQKMGANGMSDDPYWAQRVQANQSRALTPEEQARSAATQAAGIDAGGAGGPAAGGRGSYADKLSGQVSAYGDMVGQDFKKGVGQMLGDLNGIGALRSGAVQAGLNEASSTYGRQIGSYAAQTASTGLGMDENARQFDANLGQNASQFDKTLGFNREQFNADSAYRDKSLAQSGSQFDRNLAQSGSQFDKTLGFNNQQFDFNRAFTMSEANRDQTNRNTDNVTDERRYQDAKSASKKRGIGQILGGLAGGALSFLPGGGAAVTAAKAAGSVFGGG